MNQKLHSALAGIAVTLAALHEAGVTVGHIAGSDFVALAATLVAEALGAYATPPATT